jgi:hypothetical protein
MSVAAPSDLPNVVLPVGVQQHSVIGDYEPESVDDALEGWPIAAGDLPVTTASSLELKPLHPRPPSGPSVRRRPGAAAVRRDDAVAADRRQSSGSGEWSADTG